MDSLQENFSDIAPNKKAKAHPRQNNSAIIISLWKIFRFQISRACRMIIHSRMFPSHTRRKAHIFKFNADKRTSSYLTTVERQKYTPYVLELCRARRPQLDDFISSSQCGFRVCQRDIPSTPARGFHPTPAGSHARK